MRRILLLAAGLLGALGVIEVALRARGFDPVGELLAGGLLPVRSSAGDGLRYELVPGVAGEGWQTWFELSSAGLRDREYTRAKPDGVRRVVALGDSLTFGTGVPVEATFVEQLELALAGERVEVLNCGVPGYDLLDALAHFEHVGASFDPDLVLVGYCVNDVGVHSVSLEYLEALERLSSPLYRIRIAQWLALARDKRTTTDWQAEVNEDAAFARRFAADLASLDGDDELEALRRAVAATREPRDAYLAWYASPVKLARLRGALERLARLAREREVEVLLAYLPYPQAASCPETHATVRRILAHECERAGVPFVDPTGELSPAGLDAFRQTTRDPLHLNAAGHRWVAHTLTEPVRAALAP